MTRSANSVLRPALAALGLLLASPSVPRAANGVIDLSWGNCSPVVANLVATNEPASLIASVIGNDQTHNAYQVRFVLGSAERTAPDAWRFDAAGCQGSGALTIEHIAPASVAKFCPDFQGPAAASIQIKDYSFVSNGSNYPPTMMRGVLANTYPAGATAVPTQRYFLAAFRFDHAKSVSGGGTPGVSCGGLETPLCIQLLTGLTYRDPAGTSSWLRMSDGVEMPFDPGNVAATVNGIAGCPAVPVAPTTWGQLKSAYRR
jgi:hypothetical protein